MLTGTTSQTLGYFYPRPPRGGRRKRDAISFRFIEFLSTPSARRATYTVQIVHVGAVISIHALREEGDYSYIDFK